MWDVLSFAFDAMRMNGVCLQYASAELRSRPRLVFEVVQVDGTCSQYASAELKADRVIVLEAVLVNRMCLQFASAELETDRACVLGVEEVGEFDSTGVSCPCIRTSRSGATSTGSRESGYNAFKARVLSSG